MPQVLTSSNTSLVRLFKSRPASRLGLSLHVVTSGLEALATAEALKPELIVLDADLPEVDGITVCEKLKATSNLGALKIMLVFPGILDHETLAKCVAARCDYAFILPMAPEEFASAVADLLDLDSRKSKRLTSSKLLARVESDSGVWTGTIQDLSITGAKLELDHPLTPNEEVTLLLKQGHGARGKVINARVIWCVEDDCTAGVEFVDLSPETRKELESLVLWEAVPDSGELKISVDGDFTEVTDFSELTKKAVGKIEFDLSGVRRITSYGAMLWVEFLRKISGRAEYTFSRCSVPFCTMALLVDGALGSGRVSSFMAPFECVKCFNTSEELLETATFLAHREKFQRLPCPRCEGAMVLSMGFEAVAFPQP